MDNENISNNKGQVNIVQDNGTINSIQNVYKPKTFNPNKKLMITNLSMLSNNFIGREEYIKKIEFLLTKQNIVVLSGSGGIGKTQIVLKYIKENINKYKHVVFIKSSTGEMITQEYAQILDIENDKNTLSSMKNWAGINENYLFIYDNLDDEELKEEFFKKYIVSSNNGKIIITSRLNDWDNKIKINKFEEEESIKFLNKLRNNSNDKISSSKMPKKSMLIPIKIILFISLLGTILYSYYPNLKYIKLPANHVDITGDYSVTGKNLNDSTYTGIANITWTGNKYSIYWLISGKSHYGMGDLEGDVLYIKWKSGTTTGMVIYTINSGGNLVGTWTIDSKTGEGIEILTPK